MADDINAALKAELQAALDALAGPIRGAEDLKGTSISVDLIAQVEAERVRLTHRRELIQTVLQYMGAAQQALGSLEADGYPAFPSPPPLSPQLSLELLNEKADLAAAIALFSPATPATTVTVNLGAPTVKP